MITTPLCLDPFALVPVRLVGGTISSWAHSTSMATSHNMEVQVEAAQKVLGVANSHSMEVEAHLVGRWPTSQTGT